MERSLKVALWNANGVTTRRNELHSFASDHDLDIILLTETHLRPEARFAVPGYQTYRTDRPARPGRRGNPGGGTAVLVHRRLTHRELLTNTLSESTGVAVSAGGAELSIFAVYMSPGDALDVAGLEALLAFRGTVLVGGDLNAKHWSWGCRVTTARGRILQRFVERRGDVGIIATADPTYYPPRLNARPDILDVFLCRDLRNELEVTVSNDLSSDHIPVIATLSAEPVRTLPPGTTLRTDWDLFCEALQGRVVPLHQAESPQALDLQVADLHGALQEAIAVSTSQAPARATRTSLPAHIRHEISKRRRLRRIWQRTRHPATRAAFNRQCDIVKRILTDYRSETWNAYLSGLDLGDGSAWRLAKILRNEKKSTQPLRGPRGLVYSAADKAETFADTMEDQFTPHAGIRDDDHSDFVAGHLAEYFAAAPEDALPPVTVDEVEELIMRAKPKKAPGMDGVGARALKSAPAVFLLCLVSVFNSALRLHHFPDCWKVAKVILIPKPGKSRLLPQNFRPISLLSSISKLFERVILSRLSPYLDGFIRPEQFGFRRGHSTTQQLVRVVNKLVDNHNLNLSSVAVSLDASKAFDKVWHDGLLFKLSDSPLPDGAVHLLRSYLTGRTFRACVDGELSSVRTIQAGVPQGSVLGPALYLVFTNDIPTVAGVTLSLYADDAMFLCRSARPARAAQVMQHQMDELSPWLRKWRIGINTDKSHAVCFRKKRRMPRAAPPPVTLDGQPINWTSTVKYLGVTLDSRLNFGAHVTAKAAEAKKLCGLLNPLIGRRSTLPVGAKTTIFLACVRSVLMYACTAWWTLCSRTNRKKLQVIQNKAFRAISGQPWFVRNATIRLGLGAPTLEDFARTTSEKLLRSAATSTLPHIAEIALRNGPPEVFRPRPAAILDFEPP